MRVAAVNPGNANLAQLQNPENIELRKPQATVLNSHQRPGNPREYVAAPCAVFGEDRVVKVLEEVKSVLAREKVSVCFCGFWLLDGTYRDVVRHLRLRRAEIPAVIVCALHARRLSRLSCSAEHQRVRFICHPYQKSD